MYYVYLFSRCVHSTTIAQWIPQIVSGPTVHVTKDTFVAEGINEILPSNNNVAAEFYNGKLFMGWRSAPTHFASSKYSLFFLFITSFITLFLFFRTRMILVSSVDLGQSWSLETIIERGTDLREPYFLEVNGTLFFYFFEAGTNPIAFEPSFLQRIEYLNVPSQWSEPESWGQESEVAWQYDVVDDGVGNHISIYSLLPKKFVVVPVLSFSFSLHHKLCRRAL